MTALSIVQAFCGRTGLTVPSAVFASSNRQIIQIRELLNELLFEIVNSTHTYSPLIRQASFTSVNGADQGLLTTRADSGYRSIIPGTMFNRTQNLAIPGPIGPEEWQRRQAMAMTGTMYSYREWMRHLWFTPNGVAGDTIAFEYRSNYAVYDGATPKAAFTKDTDTCVFPEHFLIAGLRWKWKEEKGLDFASLREAYVLQLETFKAQDGTKAVLNLADSEQLRGTGIVIPFGSFNQ